MKYIYTIIFVALIISAISKTNDIFFFRFTITLLPSLLAVRSIKKPILSPFYNIINREAWLKMKYKKDIKRLKRESK